MNIKEYLELCAKVRNGDSNALDAIISFWCKTVDDTVKESEMAYLESVFRGNHGYIQYMRGNRYPLRYSNIRKVAESIAGNRKKAVSENLYLFPPD